MKIPCCYCFLAAFFFFSSNLLGQSPCADNPNPPFGLSSSITLCATDDNLTSLSFTIFNTGNPGTYEIIFPDGTDTTLTNVNGNLSVAREFLFECEDMPGNPIPPNSNNHFFSYLNQLVVTRTDCVDALGQFSTGFFDFNVIPNPIKGFSNSNTECIGAPFLVDFSASVCDVDLVQSFKWFVDGVQIPTMMGMEDEIEDYSFPGPGTYLVRLEITDYFNCGPYSYEEEITITADPTIIAALNIDSSDLCQSIIEIGTSNNSLYSDFFNWSSPSGDISFSDPSSPNPIITIDNTTPGTYTIILEATNADCGSVTQNFQITTFNEQEIDIGIPLVTCTQTEIDICNFIDFAPNPLSVNWTSIGAEVSITNSNALCPLIEISAPGDFILNAAGSDICNNPFSIDIPIAVTPSQDLIFNLSSIDTLCESDNPINLLNFIVPSNYIVSCMGDGVSNCQFNPNGNMGLNTISLIDSCGVNHEIDIFVTQEGGFQGGNPTVCIGNSINLFQIQEGTYSGNGVVNNIFQAELAGIGTQTIDFVGTSFCGGTGQFQITVVDNPTASFSILNPSCTQNTFVFPEGENIEINNTSSTIVLCYEVLETGDQVRGNNTANFTYNNSGEYNIQQIVEIPSGGCQDTIVETIFIEPLYMPTIISVIDTTDCDSVLVNFSIDTIVSTYQYFWTFSNGETSNLPNPNLIIERPFLSAVFSSNLNIVTLCDTISFFMEEELPAQFQISFDILNDNNTICSGEAAYFQNTSSNYDSLSIRYNFDNTSSVFMDSFVYHNVSDTIVYLEILLEGFRAGCPSIQVTDTLVILPINTIAEFSLSWDDIPCSPFIVRLMNSSTPGASEVVYWGDDSTPQQIGSLEEVEHEYYFENDTTIWITLISELCGKDTIRKQLDVYASPDVDFEYFPISEQCENDSILFIPFGNFFENYDFDWIFGDSTISHSISPTHSYSEGGIYDVTLSVTDTDGCSSTFTLPIEIDKYTGVNLEIEVSNIICENGIFELDILSSENQIWIDYGNGLVGSDILSTPYLQEGDYILSFSTIDNNGCSQDTSVLVAVIPPIEVSIIPNKIDTIVEFGDEILLDFSTTPLRNIEDIQWEGDSLRNPNLKITNALPIDDGYYNLIIEDEFGCIAEDSIFVWINKEYDERIFIPNAFSPNDDGVNDKFYIFSKPNTVNQINVFQIFSRWGEMVFECQDCFPNDPNFGWEGYLDGRSMNPGVFTWLAQIEFADGETRLFNGDVTLIK